MSGPGTGGDDGASKSTPACPACKASEFEFRFTKNGRDFWRCVRCGVERQQPLPTAAELTRYYETAYATGMYKTFVEADLMKRMTAEARLSQIRGLVRSGRWLDVGCANGVFVETAHKAGMSAEGIELSEKAVDLARQRGLQVTCSTIEDFRTTGAFDTVTAFDVIEHVIDPPRFLAEARRLLAPNGTLAMTLPDLGSAIRSVMGPRWYFYIPEEHLHYFNRQNMARLLKRCGFRPLEIKSAYKPLSIDYSLTQFREYNPAIYRLMSLFSTILPRSMRARPLPLYIGEMLAIATPSDG